MPIDRNPRFRPSRRRRRNDGPNKGGKGGKKDGKGKKGRKGSKLYRQARRDVMLSIRPVRREIRKVRKQGVRDYKRGAQKVENIYEGLAAQLAPLGGAFTQQSGQIANMLNQNLGTLTGTIGSTVPGVSQAELTGGANLMGALGGGALAGLASNAQRNAAFQNSVGAQAATEGAFARRNMLADLMGFKQDLRDERLGLMRDVPSLIRQRMDEERDRNFERMLALRQQQLDRLVANRDFSLANRGLGLEARQLGMDARSNAALTRIMQARLKAMLQGEI